MRGFIEFARPSAVWISLLLLLLYRVTSDTYVQVTSEILARGRSKLADSALHLAKKKRGCDVARYRRHPLAEKKLVASPLTRWIFSLHLSTVLSSSFLSVTKHYRLSSRYVPSTCVNPLESLVMPSWDLNPELANTPDDVLPASSNGSQLLLYFALCTTRIIYDAVKDISN